MSIELPVYLDNAATTPVDPRVAVPMSQMLTATGGHGNPSSIGHSYGRRARDWVESARSQVANLIAARPEGIVFTSGATESNNLAILGAARFQAGADKSGKRHLITSRTEHKAVLGPMEQLEREGFEVTYLKPDVAGIVHPEQITSALRDDTLMVSLMHVNNEIGVIQDVASVGQICRERGVLLHVDAAQSVGKLPINVEAMQIDLLSMTAHKMYGPKGIGALYVRPKPPLGLKPLVFGGGHEHGVRSGTLPVHQIVGFGLACDLAAADREADTQRVYELRKRLWSGLHALGGVELNGHPTQCLPGILNVAFHGVEGESWYLAIRDLAVSSGSACSSDSDEASYVLRALGRSDQLAGSSVRFSLGRFSTLAEVDVALAVIGRELPRLRELVP
jgi:cysteine desulfurase